MSLLTVEDALALVLGLAPAPQAEDAWMVQDSLSSLDNGK